MLEGGIYAWAVPLGRTTVGFVVGAFLGMMGGWFARIFNAMVGYSWDPGIHANIFLLGIGIGAGLGAYLGWLNLSLRWYLIVLSALVVLLGGLAGVYIGSIYGQNIDPTFLGQGASVVNMIHWGAVIGAIAVSTAIGLFNEVRSGGR